MTTKIKASNIDSGAVTADKLSSTAISDKLGYAPVSPTALSNAVAGVDLTGLATETYVNTQITNLVDSAPTALNTLNELAAALGDDANYASTITTALGTKLATGDFASTFDTRLATKSTSNLSEGTNLYYSDARARSAVSAGSGISYNSSTGVITSTIPDATNASNISSGTLNSARLATGTTIQVVSAVQAGVVSTNSSSYVDIPGLSVNITPTSSSNKILVIVSMGGAAPGGITDIPVLRNGSTIGNVPFTFYDNGDGNTINGASLVYLDSPSTTSTLTYKVQWKNNQNNTTYLNANRSGGGNTRTSTITVMEVKA